MLLFMEDPNRLLYLWIYSYPRNDTYKQFDKSQVALKTEKLVVIDPKKMTSLMDDPLE